MKYYPAGLFFRVEERASIRITLSASSAVVLEGAVVVLVGDALPVAYSDGLHQPRHDMRAQPHIAVECVRVEGSHRSP